MRLAFLILFALAVGGGHGTAWAEKAKAKEGAKLFNRAGERGEVLFKLKEGQVMRILKTEGRWHKVNVKGRTGWIPRSKVEVVEEETQRNTRRQPFVDGRGTKRGFGGEAGPDDRVGGDAVSDKGGDDGDGDEKPHGKPRKNGGGDDGDDGDDGDTKPPKKPKPTAKPPKKPVAKKPVKPSKDADAEDGDPDGDEPKIVDEGDEKEAPADARPRVRVTAKATVYSEPNADADEAEWKVKPDMVLFVTGKKGKYTEVENADADIGYILTSKTEEVEGGVDEGEGGNIASRQIDLRARVGVTLIQQGTRSSGGMNAFPDNYNLNSSAATIALGGAYLRPYSKKVMLGGEATLDIGKSVPGVKSPVPDAAGKAVTESLTLYHLNVRALIGYDLKKGNGMMLFGRLGYRYQSYQVADVGNLDKNTAKLPSEIIQSPTVGGALSIPKLTDKIGLRFSLDTMLVGVSLKQTKGLEDGSKPAAKGAVLGAGFSYRWKPNMDIQASYDLSYTTYDFGAPLATSQRGHMGMDVKRTDIFHGVTAGIAKAF